jgi:DNA-binding transcriptional ArsR family regulator
MNHQFDLDTKVKFMRGFADKTRIQILECIKGSEKTVSQIVNEIKGNQSNISQHLACLKGCGIVLARQDGKFMYYGLRNEQVRELLQMFNNVFYQVEQEVAVCEKNEELPCCDSTEKANV